MVNVYLTGRGRGDGKEDAIVMTFIMEMIEKGPTFKKESKCFTE